jgi:molybdopterin molybdotransferase
VISVDEALEKVLAGVSRLPSEQIALGAALGRVLAVDVASRLTQPPTAMSAMDGYAVRAADVSTVPAVLTRIGESSAGSGFAGSIGAGEAVRIFTGAPVPDGADAIVIQENTEADGHRITVNESAPAGRYIRPAGLDFRAGEVLLTAGTLLGARDVALLAGMNVPWVRVTRKPRVAILSTGDELVMPGEPLGADQIISSNSVGLEAFITALGGEPLNLGIARDNIDSLKSHLAGVKGADLLVTIGGASVGDYDLVRDVLGGEGLEIAFFTVAMRPGKPLIFGHIQGTPMLGLPGNPVSAGVTTILFVRPAINLMLGLKATPDTPETAALGRDLAANDRRQDYLRSELSINGEGELTVTPFDQQDSSMLALFTKADCLAIRPPFAAPAKAGDKIAIIRLDHGTVSI